MIWRIFATRFGAVGSVRNSRVPNRSTDSSASVSKFVPANKKGGGRCQQQKTCGSHNAQGEPSREVAYAEKAVPKAVDHVKERVEKRSLRPEGRQLRDRIKHAREESKRQNDKRLKRPELIVLFGPKSADDAEPGHDAGAEKRKHDRPQRMRERRNAPKECSKQHACAHDQAARDGGGNVGRCKLPTGKRRKQNEDHAARDLGLQDGRGRVGETVLQQRHHH